MCRRGPTGCAMQETTVHAKVRYRPCLLTKCLRNPPLGPRAHLRVIGIIRPVEDDLPWSHEAAHVVDVAVTVIIAHQAFLQPDDLDKSAHIRVIQGTSEPPTLDEKKTMLKK
jgi:hypothetical protein